MSKQRCKSCWYFNVDSINGYCYMFEEFMPDCQQYDNDPSYDDNEELIHD